MTVRQFISLNILHPCLHIVNLLMPKNERNIFFLPHHNCKHDHYDVINYQADNTLCLINYMLTHKQYNGYTFYILHYDNTKEVEYIDYCHKINPSIKCIFIYAQNTQPTFKQLLAFYRCKYAFTSDIYYNFTSKLKKQVVTSLGYFTPFKSDDLHLDDRRIDMLRNYYNHSYSFQITTSKISSHIQCADKGLYWNRHRVLGFPRNDIFYQSTNSNILQQLERSVQMKIKKIILFTPTYRDYESRDSEKHNIFGFPIDSNFMLNITNLLENNEAVLIFKLHPWQEESCIIDSTSKRLINYRDIPFICNLYTLMAETDVLITDYTSTYFDFLHRDKPVIFNFYDLDKYEQLRGLSYQPIDCIAAGHIVKDANQLLNALKDTLEGRDLYSEKRKYIHQLFNYHHDGNSAERICKFVLGRE